MTAQLRSFTLWAVQVGGAIAAFLNIEPARGLNQPYVWIGIALSATSGFELMVALMKGMKTWPALHNLGVLLGVASVTISLCIQGGPDYFDASQPHFYLWTFARLSLLGLIVIVTPGAVYEVQHKNAQRVIGR